MRKLNLSFEPDLFFEPESIRQRIIKWTTTAAVLLIGICLFLTNIDNVAAYEKACRDPVYVQATITVRKSTSLLASAESLDAVLDYNYNGIQYRDVLYESSRNPAMWDDHGESVTVAVNPENPGQLASDMVNWFLFTLSEVITALGISLLIYGVAIGHEPFRQRRFEKAVKKYKLATHPDYVSDVFWIFVPIFAIVHISLSLCFPNAFGLISFISSI